MGVLEKDGVGVVGGGVLHRLIAPVDDLVPVGDHVPLRLKQCHDEGPTLVQHRVVNGEHQIGQIGAIVVAEVGVARRQCHDVVVAGLK